MKLEQIFGIIANEGFTYYFIARFLPGQNTIHHTPRVPLRRRQSAVSTMSKRSIHSLKTTFSSRPSM